MIQGWYTYAASEFVFKVATQETRVTDIAPGDEIEVLLSRGCMRATVTLVGKQTGMARLRQDNDPVLLDKDFEGHWKVAKEKT